MSNESFEALDEDPLTGHAEAEGAAEVEAGDVGSESTLRSMLMSTGPSESLDAVESPWDPERGGVTRIFRGIKKMTGADGIPAVADVLIGAAEWWQSLEVGDNDNNAERDSGAPGEPPGGV